MTITMDDTQITTLEQVQAVLDSPEGLAFNRAGRAELYGWIDSVLKRFDYFKLCRKAKGQVKAYVQRLSGLSRAQLTRLVTRDLLEGEIKPGYARRNRFATVYTNFDKEARADGRQDAERLCLDRNQAQARAAGATRLYSGGHRAPGRSQR